MRVRVAFTLDVDAVALRLDSHIVAPDATAADIRRALRTLARIEIENALPDEDIVRIVR
ncbi:hypothetical protein [Mycobacteroides salmoniphilum]|uniref:Uncharacterized protein n=1 Tax=Mycobacteroides salmoniphilum TaxID=404941 RepID=A0A4R8SZW8_9MYCO|nr:hypothetical protein [Mycobacteroides salmoniphilum]TEA09101.1 hypothetical protein CCUG60884_00270 [Mycobacteroides salmoniphilum]